MKNLNENRRDFIKKASSVVGFGLFAGSFGSVITSCESDEVIKAGPIKPPVTVDIDLAPLGITVGKTVKYLLKYTSGTENKERKVFIYRKNETTFTVYDTLCPHLGCEVDAPTDGTVLANCPCHNVKFSVEDGSVKVNPISWAGEPLQKIKVFAYDATKNTLQLLV